MNGMTRPKFKRKMPTDADRAIARAPEDAPVFLDIERMQASLQSPSFVMPSGLSPEQKIEFMLAVAAGHR